VPANDFAKEFANRMNEEQKEKFKHLLEPSNIANYKVEQLKAK
jgi:succinate dehydrogenase flavin-adding protein (antitoxin of CptAB toxin-antitoxin module)